MKKAVVQAADPDRSSMSPPLRAAAAGLSLSLAVEHNVQLSPKLHTVKQSLPSTVDVVSSSNIVFSICGSLNRGQISPERLRKSALVHYLLSYLKMARNLWPVTCSYSLHRRQHSEELGLDHISHVYIDQDHVLKCTNAPALCLNYLLMHV